MLKSILIAFVEDVIVVGGGKDRIRILHSIFIAIWPVNYMVLLDDIVQCQVT